MGVIHVLNDKLSNMIAAGEVVERPASVVKELVENSIDAGAKNLTVEIKNGGISYIRITDDGCGISKEDAKLAFLRHSTSKISSAEDLFNIHTLGFRGEALASIASVSNVDIITKRPCDEAGTHLSISAGKILSEDLVGARDGTTITVKNLFFNREYK